MTTKLPPVDAVIIGVGWAGSILAAELSRVGLKVVGLERGGYRGQEQVVMPEAHDELKYDRRLEHFQDLSRSTVSIRNTVREVARPQRRHGPFPWGTGLGGSGFLWAGWTWRHTPWDFKIKSRVTERYGADVIPEDATIQDWPMTYEDLEPYYDQFEYAIGLSGKAGNLNGDIQEGGNPFEGPRQRDYPNPPLKRSHVGALFETACKELGYHPFPLPAAQMSRPYTNPYGVSMGECIFCGYCMNYGCEVSARSVPQTTTLPAAFATGNFEARTHAAVTRINTSGNRATGVTYVDARGREFEQPAEIVLLTAFTWSNVQLLLVSGIGQAYDPVSGNGVVGKNFSWHSGSVFAPMAFDKGHFFNGFMGAGALGTAICDLQGDNFDHSDLGFIGGNILCATQMGGGPLGSFTVPTPPGTPAWGSAWKKAINHYYNRTIYFSGIHDHLAYRGNYLSLDPTYRDTFGNPLVRVTFDFGPNERKLSQYMVGKAKEIAKAMKPSTYAVYGLPPRFDGGAGTSTTHQAGGAICGDSPATSVVNRYLQSWDMPNLFVVGGSAFPQITSFNPTGTIGALAYWTADAIVNRYIPSPGPLVDAP